MKAKIIKKKKGTKLIELSALGQTSRPGIADILREVLASLGIDPQNIVEFSAEGRSGVKTFMASISKANQLKEKLKRLSLKGVSVQLIGLERPDWQERWKKDFQPFHLTRRLDVVPFWHRRKYTTVKGRVPILIDTITAFGTGLHDTTQFMSELIEERAGQFKSFLDIGTGTGILSLVALKSQAREVCAIDMDKECIAVAKSNLKLNGHQFNWIKAVDIKDLSVKNKFDYVAANLITHDLVRLKRKICSMVAVGKFLAVSGISLENLAWLKREFQKLPVRCLKVKKSKHWVAVLYQRKRAS